MSGQDFIKQTGIKNKYTQEYIQNTPSEQASIAGHAEHMDKLNQKSKLAARSTQMVGNAMKMIGSIAIMEAISWAIQGIGSLFDSLFVSLEEKKQNLSELSINFDNTCAELDGVNEQLDTMQQRIEELRKKDSLSFMEQDELNKLEQATVYLKEQQGLLDSKKKQEAQELADANKEVFKQEFGSLENYTHDERAGSLYNFHSELSQNAYAQDAIKLTRTISTIEEELNKNDLEEAERTFLEGALKTANENLQKSDWQEVVAQLMDYRETLLKTVDGDVSKLEGTEYSEINQWIEAIWSTADRTGWEKLGPSTEIVSAIQGILGKQDFENIIRDLKGDFNGENLDDLLANLFSTNTSLADILEESGISQEVFSDYIRNVLDPNALELKDMKASIMESTAGSPELTSDAIASRLDRYSSQEIEIAYGIVSSTDTSTWSLDDFDAAIAEYSLHELGINAELNADNIDSQIYTL